MYKCLILDKYTDCLEWEVLKVNMYSECWIHTLYWLKTSTSTADLFTFERTDPVTSDDMSFWKFIGVTVLCQGTVWCCCASGWGIWVWIVDRHERSAPLHGGEEIQTAADQPANKRLHSLYSTVCLKYSYCTSLMLAPHLNIALISNFMFQSTIRLYFYIYTHTLHVIYKGFDEKIDLKTYLKLGTRHRGAVAHDIILL